MISNRRWREFVPGRKEKRRPSREFCCLLEGERGGVNEDDG